MRMREKHKPNAHISYEQAGLVASEWGLLVSRAELIKFLPFGLAATHAWRAGGSTGYFGRLEKHAGHIHRRSQSSGPVSETHSEAWARLAAASIFPIKVKLNKLFGFVNSENFGNFTN